MDLARGVDVVVGKLSGIKDIHRVTHVYFTCKVVLVGLSYLRS